MMPKIIPRACAIKIPLLLVTLVPLILALDTIVTPRYWTQRLLLPPPCQEWILASLLLVAEKYPLWCVWLAEPGLHVNPSSKAGLESKVDHEIHSFRVCLVGGVPFCFVLRPVMSFHWYLRNRQNGLESELSGKLSINWGKGVTVTGVGPWECELPRDPCMCTEPKAPSLLGAPHQWLIGARV